MTITTHDRIAILPKRCDKCNRLFWLEPYNIFGRTINLFGDSIEYIECKKCESKRMKPESEEKIMEKKWSEIEIDVAKKIWSIAGISPEYGNAVMDVIGEETYQNVMRLQSEKNTESEETNG